MGKRSPYDPYEVVEQSNKQLRLQLSASQQLFYRIVTRILPGVITIALSVLFMHLLRQGETQKLWWVLLAMTGPLMLLFIPSWPDIHIRKGMITVSRHQGFSTKTNTFQVDAGSAFEARLIFLHKNVYYNVYLIHPQGRRQKIFEIPTPPFSLRRREKDNLLEALRIFSLPSETDTA